jgi:hypothetical protein
LGFLIEINYLFSKYIIDLFSKHKNYKMKHKYLLVLLLLAVCVSATTSNKFVGVWRIVEFTLFQNGVPVKSNEKALRDAGSVWNMYFNEDGSFKQEFNMRSTAMTMETENGTWRTEADSLFIEIKAGDFTTKLNYTYVSLGDAFVLTLQHPETPDKMVVKFRRK